MEVALAQSSAQTIVRHVRLGATRAKSLKEALTSADSIFDSVASSCGAQVVRHSWGLSEADDVYFQQYYSDEGRHPELLPDGHVLTAEVDVIHNLNPLEQYQEQAVSDSLHSHFSGHRPVWGDGYTEQFVNGIAPGESIPGLWLIDIEPVLYY